MSKEKCCGNCKHFKDEDIEGNGWCARLKQVSHCSFNCRAHKSESDDLSRFEKKCLSLAIGYDRSVCDGKYCVRKLTCLRYMLYKKAKIEDYDGHLWYVHKLYNNKCHLKYDG